MQCPAMEQEKQIIEPDIPAKLKTHLTESLSAYAHSEEQLTQWLEHISNIHNEPSAYKTLPRDMKVYIAKLIVEAASSKQELTDWLEKYSRIDREHKDIPQHLNAAIAQKLKELRLQDRHALMQQAQEMINNSGYGDPNDILSSNDPDAPNHIGLTALTVSILNSHFWIPGVDLSSFLPNTQLIEILLKLGANPNVPTHQPLLMITLMSSDFLGNTNLYSFKEKIVELLVQFGADINATGTINGNQNVTPLDYALERALFKPEYNSIAKFLKKHGAIANHTHRHSRASLWARGMSAVLGSEAARLWTEND